jgi:hypothetical protein
MIIRGVQQGRALYGGKFDLGDVWSRRATVAGADSARVDTLSVERQTNYVFLLAFHPDSISQNQLLYEMAKYNFSNFLVRNFDITLDQDALGMTRMLISGFLSYDEARQYARLLYDDKAMAAMLKPCRSLIVSEANLRLLGTQYSYQDYEVFFQKELAPISVPKESLLNEPETIVQPADEDEGPAPADDGQPASDDPLFNDAPQQQNTGYPEFDDDFWR